MGKIQFQPNEHDLLFIFKKKIIMKREKTHAAYLT